MNKFKFLKTYIKDLYLIKPKVFSDNRGDFFRYFCFDDYKKIFFKNKILQTNICTNKSSGTLRGLHYQKSPYSETKIITCVSGEIFDVAVDLRRKSKTFMKYFGTKLSAKNKYIFIIPKGFAHGYITLKKNSTVVYLVDNKYNPESECGIRYNDPNIRVKWPTKPKFISIKDKNFTDYYEKNKII